MPVNDAPKTINLPHLNWDKVNGLIPVIIQDVATLRVLMLGYMNPQALEHTCVTGQVTFFSRSKQRLWTKGESSGHYLDVVAIHADCDEDTLLITARAHGPTCHTGTVSCFDGFAAAPGNFLGQLELLLQQRFEQRPQDSYSSHLFNQGTRYIAQKVGEEGVETALAAVVQDDAALLGESADLLFHLIALLRARHLSLHEAVAVLEQRQTGK